MDITAVVLNDVLTVYNRQEKLAQARKAAEPRLIKTAVSERITLSNDAKSLLSIEMSQGSRPASEVVQKLPGGREFHSAAREYSRNKPIEEQSVGSAQEVEAASPAMRLLSDRGRPQNLPAQTAQPQSVMAHISTQQPSYSFPIPRELQAYISSLPKEKWIPPKSANNQRAAA